jgi:hypothetical protein
LLIRSAESLGRVIGSLQRQLDGAARRLKLSADGNASPSSAQGTDAAATHRRRESATPVKRQLETQVKTPVKTASKTQVKRAAGSAKTPAKGAAGSTATARKTTARKTPATQTTAKTRGRAGGGVARSANTTQRR